MGKKHHKGSDVIATLWGGNGVAERCEVVTTEGETLPCVAKRIQCPKDSSVDAKRKRKSYHNELAFYRNVAPDLLTQGVCPVPRPMELSAQGDQITLVLSDISGEYPVSKDFLSPAQTQTALRWLAAFHAKYWQSPHLHQGLAKRGSYWFLDTRPVEFKRIDPRRYERLRRCAPALSARLLGVVSPGGRRQYSPAHLTLVHGDFKPANIQFTRDASRCVAYDFQYAGRGYGALDLAYLLFPDGLSDHDSLRHYHRALLSSLADTWGTEHPGPSFEQLVGLVELSFLDFFRFLLGWCYHERRAPAALERESMKVLTKIDGGTLLTPQGYFDAIAAAYPLA